MKSALVALDDEQYQDLVKTATTVERVPAKVVAVVRAPDARKKARVVACGNMAQHPSDDTAAGGIDTIATRALIRTAADRLWEVASIDVTTAFLQAPRRKVAGKITVVDPPSILRETGIAKVGEMWLVQGALCGFVESPADWSCYRDSVLEGRDLLQGKEVEAEEDRRSSPMEA